MNLRDTTFREIVDELPDLVCRITPDGILLYVNRAYADYFERTPAQLVGTSYLELVPVDAQSDARANLAAISELTPSNSVRTDMHCGGDRAGQRRWQEWVDKAFFDHNGAITDVLCVGRDVTERVVAHEQVRYHSRYDSLTGLVNRRCTLEALDAAVVRAHRTGSPLGLLFIDLDGFKEINDRHGHRAGDRMLTDVAGILARSVRNSDAAGRLGGDEFVVICTAIETLIDLDDIAGRITERLGSMPRPISASFGAVLLRAGETADDLLHRADVAMYTDKQQARRIHRPTG